MFVRKTAQPRHRATLSFALVACLALLGAGCTNNVGPGVAGFGGFGGVVGVSGFGPAGWGASGLGGVWGGGWGVGGFGVSGFGPGWGAGGFGGPLGGFCPPPFICGQFGNQRMCLLGGRPPRCQGESRVCNSPVGGICREVQGVQGGGQRACVLGC
ncbi:MAG: hypothetical protein MJD61_13595 [Proteobacteria bacterium]|nr:hypothetical protein [Pseudomonadota bacterium]